MSEELEEIITDYANAVEAAAFNMKSRIAKKHGVQTEKTEVQQTTGEPIKYNPENIPWVRAEGKNGIYERYPAYQQKPAMLTDYINLLADLTTHNGKLQRSGLFYWKFPDGSTIGRKPSKK